jgi:hypothetical protein
MLHARIDFGHNYNYVSRAAMYRWFNRHLKLGLDEPIVEEDYRRLTQQEMTVWNEQHPKPEAGPDVERAVLRWWREDARKQLAALRPTDKQSLRRFREVVGGGIDVVIGRGLPAADDVQYEEKSKNDEGHHVQSLGLLRNKPHGEESPIVIFRPRDWRRRVVIWLHESGKAGLFQGDGRPKSGIDQLISHGAVVVGADLLCQGEFLVDGKPVERTRRVKNPREAAAYTFGYNHSLFARRVHDVLSVIAFVRSREWDPDAVYLVGLGRAGHWAAAACAQARGAVNGAVIDTSGFRFGKLTDIHHPDFLPGGAKYGDLPGMLAAAAPVGLWLAGEGEQAPAIVSAAYEAAAASERLKVFDGEPGKKKAAAVRWLLDRLGNGAGG